MSLPEGKRGYRARILRLALLPVLCLAAACTVQPLYGTGGRTIAVAGTPVGAELSQIAVAPVNERVAQELRNHLIFLLHGGTAPETPRYRLGLTVSAFTSAAASIQVGRDEEPTASLVTVTALYVLEDAATGARLAEGRRSTIAPFDVSRQQFAALRAERDAQNRAAREAAELVRLAVAQDLAKLSTR